MKNKLNHLRLLTSTTRPDIAKDKQVNDRKGFGDFAAGHSMNLFGFAKRIDSIYKNLSILPSQASESPCRNHIIFKKLPSTPKIFSSKGGYFCHNIPALMYPNIPVQNQH